MFNFLTNWIFTKPLLPVYSIYLLPKYVVPTQNPCTLKNSQWTFEANSNKQILAPLHNQVLKSS